MNDDDMNDPILAEALAALRAGVAGHDAPRSVEKELMQAYAGIFAPPRRWYHKLATPGWSLAGSYAGVTLVLLLFALAPHPQRPITPGAPLAGRDGAGFFIALDSLERIEQEPAPRMVQAQVPRTALAPLGVAVTPENAGDSVRAEMLVGADGHALALRLTSLN
jgi:hypothetical protein